MRREITEQRRRIFIETLQATGSMCAAARAATPWSRGEKGGLESCRDLMRRDPTFALEVEEARDAALGRVEAEIVRRAVEGVQRPIFQKGELVGHEPVYSDHLLLRLAQRLDPSSWTDRQKVEHSGRVEHAAVMLQVTAGDILLLPEEKQEVLVTLLSEIGELKHGKEVPALPPGSQEAQRGEAVG